MIIIVIYIIIISSITSGLVPLVATWNCQTSYKNEYPGLLLLHLLFLFNPRLTLLCRYYFGRCSSEVAQLVPFPFSRGRFTRYSDRLHDFCVTILRCYKDVSVNTSFPRRARLWNSLPIECFLLTYDLSSFKSRINTRLLILGPF